MLVSPSPSRPEVDWTRRTLLTTTLSLAAVASMPELLSAATFDQYVKTLTRKALRAGHSRSMMNKVVATIRYDRNVASLAKKQPEFVKPVWKYLDDVVSKKRLEEGRVLSRSRNQLLRSIEKKYGVDRFTILAIWGVETSYGKVLKNRKVVRPVFRSLASLGYASPRRRKYSETQFLAALEIGAQGIVAVDKMRGSWAGAMGHTQFIPTTYLAYGADFTGDGISDIWRSVPDALASTANYLSKSGWRDSEPWGVAVNLPRRFDLASVDADRYYPAAQWERAGVKSRSGASLHRLVRAGRLYQPAGAEGPAFLLTRNFKALLAYNNSHAYSLAISTLADDFRGAPRPADDWSDASPPISRSERRELQKKLNRLGYNAGSVDGRIGPRSRMAVRAYQRKYGLAPDGYASERLLRHIRSR